MSRQIRLLHVENFMPHLPSYRRLGRYAKSLRDDICTNVNISYIETWRNENSKLNAINAIFPSVLLLTRARSRAVPLRPVSILGA